MAFFFLLPGWDCLFVWKIGQFLYLTWVRLSFFVPGPMSWAQPFAHLTNFFYHKNPSLGMWYFLVGTFPWLAVCLCLLLSFKKFYASTLLYVKGVFEKGHYSSNL